MAITWPMMASGLGVFDPSHRSWSDLAGLGSRSIQTILSLILALLGSALSETQLDILDGLMF
jgi:hypothetical protein